jgi:hypothetical protein
MIDTAPTADSTIVPLSPFSMLKNGGNGTPLVSRGHPKPVVGVCGRGVEFGVFVLAFPDLDGDFREPRVVGGLGPLKAVTKPEFAVGRGAEDDQRRKRVVRLISLHDLGVTGDNRLVDLLPRLPGRRQVDVIEFDRLDDRLRRHGNGDRTLFLRTRLAQILHRRLPLLTLAAQRTLTLRHDCLRDESQTGTLSSFVASTASTFSNWS